MQNDRRALVLLASLFFLTPSAAPAATGEDACIKACPSRRGAFGKRTYDKSCVLKCLSGPPRASGGRRKAPPGTPRLGGPARPPARAGRGIPSMREILARERQTQRDIQKAKASLRRAEDSRSSALRKGQEIAAKFHEKTVLFAKLALWRASERIAWLKALKDFYKKRKARARRNRSEEVDEAFDEIGFVRNPAWQRRLDDMVRRLQAMSLRPDEPITIKIANRWNPFVSPAAATGTTIYVNERYLRRAPSEDELLFVIGHEMAHVHLRHYDLMSAKLTRHWKQLDKTGLDRLNARNSRAFGLIREAAIQAETGDFSREQEMHADIVGLRYALRTGAHPRGAKQILDRMQRREEFRKRTIPYPEQKREELTSTHPSASDRIKYLESVHGPGFWRRRIRPPAVSRSSPPAPRRP